MSRIDMDHKYIMYMLEEELATSTWDAKGKNWRKMSSEDMWHMGTTFTICEFWLSSPAPVDVADEREI